MTNEQRKNKRKEEQLILKAARNNRVEAKLPSIELEKLEFNKKMHNPLFYSVKLMRIINGYKLIVNKRVSKDNKENVITCLENGDILLPKNRPVIIAPNHVRKQDIEIMMEAIPIHMFLLSGDYENVHGNISGAMLEANGIIYFDMEASYDRKNVKYVINDLLNNNINILWFYEGSWNLSPNKPYYNGSYHIVEAALNTNAIVLPVAFDLVDNKAIVNIGEPIDYKMIYGDKKLSKDEKIEALDILKGQIGAELFNIWETYSSVKREDIGEDYWDNYKEEVLSEWKFNEEDIERKHFVDKGIVNQEDVFKHLDNLDVNINNAFLLSKKNHH